MKGGLATAGDLEALCATESNPDAALAFAHRPLFRLDDAEPFLPLAAGFAVYRQAAQSVSSKFIIQPVADCVIEYAIWYDWDIQHLYDLEHVWVHLDAAGRVVQVEGSRHGSRLVMQRPDGSTAAEQGRPLLYLEPGKHAHWADGEEMHAKSGEAIASMCGPLAGQHGVHLSNRFSDAGLIHATADQNEKAQLQLKHWQFTPSWNFTPTSDDIGDFRLVPWPDLEAWVPARVRKLLSEFSDAIEVSPTCEQDQAETCT